LERSVNPRAECVENESSPQGIPLHSLPFVLPPADDNTRPTSQPLKILIINQSFWPDVVATAQQAHDLAKYLAARGDEVSIVASRSLYGKPGATLPTFENMGGIKIHRVSRNLFHKLGLLKRSIDYVRFNLACLIKCLLLPRQHVVICLTTPPFIAVVGIALKLLKNCQFVLWSMDLYPELPVQAGIIRRDGLFHRVLKRIDVFCLRNSDRVVVLGSCMRDRMEQKGVPSRSIAMIHPWSDPVEIPETPLAGVASDHSYRTLWDIGDRFVIQYSGNYGLGHDVETIAQVMLALKGDDGIRWVIVGDGIMKPVIEAFVRKHGIRNVLLQPYQPRSRLGPLIALGDVHLVLMLPGYEGIILPSKFYGVLAAGRPSIFVGPAASEVAKVIREQNCGFVIQNGDTQRLIDALRTLRADPAQAARLGHRGREALERHYSMQHACAAWRALLHEVAKEGGVNGGGAA